MSAALASPVSAVDRRSSVFGASPSIISLIEVEPDLIEHVPATQHAAVQLALRAHALHVPKGSWTPPAADPQGMGWLIASGLMARIVRVGRRESLELLGPGDLIRPGEDEESSLVECELCWQALEPVTLAHLDARFCRATQPWPALTGVFAARAMRRARWLAVQAAIDAHPTIEERLMLMFAHLGQRMGRVGGDGVRLDLPLSHRLLAQCVQALRPSVTAGLLRLRDSGRLVQPARRTWIITPSGLEYIGELCQQEVIVC